MKTRVQHDFGRAASSYDSHALLQREVAQHLFGLSAESLRQDARILDAGCGTGYFHELMRSRKVYADITQLDLALPMCRIAASYASSPPFGAAYTLCGDCENLPFPPQFFDVVFSSLVVQWADISLSCGEFSRVLTQQGTLALATFGSDTLSELKTSFAALDDAQHVNQFLHHTDIALALKQAGFSDVTWHQEKKTVYYATVRELMRGLKLLGATYKQPSRRSLTGKGYFEKLEAAYKERFENAQGLPSTWDIYYILAKK